jgi:hypothetical protein
MVGNTYLYVTVSDQLTLPRAACLACLGSKRAWVRLSSPGPYARMDELTLEISSGANTYEPIESPASQITLAKRFKVIALP